VNLLHIKKHFNHNYAKYQQRQMSVAAAWSRPHCPQCPDSMLDWNLWCYALRSRSSRAACGVQLLAALTACRPSVTDFVFEFELHDEW